MNKAILSAIALLVLFVTGGLLLQYSPRPETSGDVSGIGDTFSLPTPSPSPTILPTEAPKDTASASINPMSDITELTIEDIRIGTGDLAKAGKTITVNYEGSLLDGTVFDSSYVRGEPFSFVLGAGDVIEGWDKGFDGMLVGGKRKLTIPASMAYGNHAIGQIPANSTLIFEVELLKVE